jgi:prepilin-type N-terminal cleavage/methylation domain-containing protein
MKGFTLIELMVVIAIIAILAALGAGFYNNFTKHVRDIKRMSDVDDIAKTLELRFDPLTNQYPAVIDPETFFANHKFPVDPSDEHSEACGPIGEPYINGHQNDCEYCFRDSETPCDGAVGSGADPKDGEYTMLNTKYFVVCANLETDQAGSRRLYCKHSNQGLSP